VIWAIPLALASILLCLGLALRIRRARLNQVAAHLGSLVEAKQRGSHKSPLQVPYIDLSRCAGCATCIQACPEEGVLGLLDGKAQVIHGARCVGHGACARECPFDAIEVTIQDLQSREDIPALSADFESPQVPGLFLAGEVTGYALVRTAVEHGRQIATTIADRLSGGPQHSCDWDVIIVGAGPAGMAASLEAKARGLRFITLEQEEIGGTVARYPRRKLVMTQPMNLPLHGPLNRNSYMKEELVTLWQELAAKHELPIRSGEVFTGLTPDVNGGFTLRTANEQFQTRFVCLAIGRRGTPRKLGVSGEELAKVTYSLVDAAAYQDRRLLIVGGGDSAVEAAMSLAEEPGNKVTISYRREDFFRLKAKNDKRIRKALADGLVRAEFSSSVAEVSPDTATLIYTDGRATQEIENDEVFVMAGGIPPFKLLGGLGVSFDPADRPAQRELEAQGTGLLRAVTALGLLSLSLGCFAYLFRNYYAVNRSIRPLQAIHELLRPTGAVGLSCGIAAALCILANLSYLERRRASSWLPGSLSQWMRLHVVTGFGALGLALIHSAYLPVNTVGGRSLLALALVVVTGTIGRYIYSLVPHNAAGGDLGLAELDRELSVICESCARIDTQMAQWIRSEVRALVIQEHWRQGFFARVQGLLSSRRGLNETLQRLDQRCQAAGMSSDKARELRLLTNSACWTALSGAHYQDLHGLLTSWRFFHRWLTVGMVLLLLLHIGTAIRYLRGLAWS